LCLSLLSVRMGVDHGEDRRRQVPQNLERRTLMQIVPPPRFCDIDTKMSVLWPSKYAKISFQPGLCPGPRWGSSGRSPDPLVGWRGDTAPHSIPHSAPTHLWRSPCVPPEVQPDVRLCLCGKTIHSLAAWSTFSSISLNKQQQHISFSHQAYSLHRQTTDRSIPS